MQKGKIIGGKQTNRSDSSLTERCGAKQAIAQTRICIPWYSCLPRMSQTPWLGITCALVCNNDNSQQYTTLDQSINNKSTTCWNKVYIASMAFVQWCQNT